MKKLQQAVIEVLIKKFYEEKKTYRQIQSLIEIEGFTRPSLGWISKLLGSKKKRFKKVM